ncbi:alpha-glucan family phosphorylase [Azohydromonas sp. G-1-1-14]|uniref:glycogen phosphorylase n=2 Tax=Azohydromonas caseinilytica TaxID=2728836 RepID=A0A848FFM5_9BURK|nr:alpha-glucan family phosphorylase [Azohydromonas caseinilytica]
MEQLDRFLTRTRIAYFSMEMAVRPEMHTYAGGLGVLAGDTARSCAELQLPMVFVTLVSRAGYFKQRITADGQQLEEPDWWRPEGLCTPLDAMTGVRIGERNVWIRPWLHVLKGPEGGEVPIILLDTDLLENDPADRELTHWLYGGDDAYRLKQEIVLGLGGVRLLRALGFELDTYHLNEGHAALLTLELLRRGAGPRDQASGVGPVYDIGQVRGQCVFTTHTPVEAGHDRFPYELVSRLLDSPVPLGELRHLAGMDAFNLTQLAMRLSGYVNGVALRHAETTQHLFPGYVIRAITNGVHVGTWTHPVFAHLYQQHVPHWQHEPELLVRALLIPEDEIWRCHQLAKADLLRRIAERTGVALDPALPLIGCARRMTGYKRPLLLFQDLDRLAAIAAKHPFQVVMAGKAHPRDGLGKQAIRQLHEVARALAGRVACVFLPDYDMELAQAMVAGSDIWLNTPRPPLEASGTSGMKAALNGVLNLSVLDGWWVEACIEGVTGWAIGEDRHDEPDAVVARHLYDKLENTVLPLYHGDPEAWRRLMRQAAAHIGSHFNSQRMMRRYAAEAYLR